jgi:hypothetical protein
MSNHPAATEYAPYHARYVDLVPEEDIVPALEKQGKETAALLRSISEEKAGFRYAPDKWTVKTLVGHFTDAERIFGYRALAVARGDTTSLPGFDENSYAAAGDFDRRSMRDLADEYEANRRATVLLFRGLSPEAWTRKGTANNSPISVKGQAYVALGHERHHLRVLREKYGVGSV